MGVSLYAHPVRGKSQIQRTASGEVATLGKEGPEHCRPWRTQKISEGWGAKHRRSQGGGKGAMPPPKFLVNIVILCFERPFSKQNSVIRQKLNILAITSKY